MRQRNAVRLLTCFDSLDVSFDRQTKKLLGVGVRGLRDIHTSISSGPPFVQLGVSEDVPETSIMGN